MELFALILVIVMFFIFYDRYHFLQRRIKRLEEEYDLLKNGIQVKKPAIKTTTAPISEIDKEVLKKERDLERKLRTASVSSTSQSISIKKEIIESTPSEKIQKQEKEQARPENKKQEDIFPLLKKNDFWKKTEKRFVENWTGFLGAIIMVIGVSFLGLYAAFKLTPFMRFFLITVFAILLYGLSNYLNKKAGWENLANWFCSSSGAIFIFACLGAIAIPGLKWVESQKIAYFILLTGVIVNLLLSFTSRQQLFASMHVVFSLASLAVVPQSKMVLIIAAIISLFGIIMTYRSKWEYHLLITISSFVLYHGYWFFKHQYYLGADIAFADKITGILVTAIIGIATYLFHYQDLYKSQKFKKLPFFIHSLNWIYMGLGFVIYSSGSKWNTILLTFAAIASFLMARYAKKQGISWLFQTDTLIAQLITILAVTTLGRWNIDKTYITFFAYLEIVLFLTIMIKEKEQILIKVGSFFFFSAAFVFFVTCINSGEKSSIFLMTLLSMATFYLSQKNNSEKEKWLYYGQVFVAQIFAIFAIILLSLFDLKPRTIMFIIYIEIFAFLALFISRQERILKNIGVMQHYLSIIVLIGISLYNYFNVKNVSFLGLVILGLMLVIEFGYHIYTTRYNKNHLDNLENFIADSNSCYEITLSDFFLNIILFTLYFQIYHFLWSVYLIVPLIIFLLIYRNNSQSKSLSWGLVLLIIASNLIALNNIVYNIALNNWKITLYYIPFFVLAVFSVRFSYLKVLNKNIKWPGIYLFAGNLIIYTYFLTNRVSPFIPGIVWILFSVIYFEITAFLAKGDARQEFGRPYRYTLKIGYLFIVLFLLRHLLVHMQSGLYLGFISLRLLIELLGIIVLIYWAIAKLPEIKEQSFGWRIKPFCWELLLLFLFYTIALEVSSVWHPLAWIIFALTVFILRNILSDDVSRFQYYSIILFWISAFHISFVSTTYITPSNKLADQAWLGGSIALIFQFIYIAYFYNNSDLTKVSFPFQGNKSGKLLGKINENQNIWIYLPFFLATALFFYWSFSKALLTFLWVLEVFAIFALSIFLKEKWFRYISVAGLVICLIRLFFYDLYKTGTITKAFVFLGIGLIMLLMNSLYTKYKDRF